jgi:isopentenyl-diphosphate Delta-isomerase
MTDRKSDHIFMADFSRINSAEKDSRFVYEPMLSRHPNSLPEVSIGGKIMKVPIWISSMTGGTKGARKINRNLAKTAAKFGLGMGLGSCHALIKDRSNLPDYDLRSVLGDDLPFYVNLGIAQVEQYLKNDGIQTIIDLVNLVKADGLIVHVNPLQEWLQIEGDRITTPPIDTIKRLLDAADLNVIVKEVGQGMGMESLRTLLELPLTAIEFGAFGGTNFSKMEIKRSTDYNADLYEPLAFIGQTAEEMVLDINYLIDHENIKVKAPALIISGGLNNFLDGYYLIQKSRLPAVYGMASNFLNHAMIDQQRLNEYTSNQIEGLRMAYGFLKVKS